METLMTVACLVDNLSSLCRIYILRFHHYEEACCSASIWGDLYVIDSQ